MHTWNIRSAISATVVTCQSRDVNSVKKRGQKSRGTAWPESLKQRLVTKFCRWRHWYILYNVLEVMARLSTHTDSSAVERVCDRHHSWWDPSMIRKNRISLSHDILDPNLTSRVISFTHKRALVSRSIKPLVTSIGRHTLFVVNKEIKCRSRRRQDTRDDVLKNRSKYRKGYLRQEIVSQNAKF